MDFSDILNKGNNEPDDENISVLDNGTGDVDTNKVASADNADDAPEMENYGKDIEVQVENKSSNVSERWHLLL
eukprot:506343-Ditylum_brightwellii.AAC.1